MKKTKKKTATKKKTTKKKCCKKGFTLIELLVVVAIIGILAGIVLISLTSARERSKKASLQSTMSSLMPVLSMCVNDGNVIQAVAAGDPICLDGAGVAVDIEETWPNPILPANLGDGWSYALGADADSDGNADTLEGVGPNVTVSCTVASGSCN